MSMFNTGDILETIEMFTQDNLDVRTVTMGISLLDCIDPDPKKACEKIYNKITTRAARLVPAVEHISAEYGIPIINKRISVTPIAMLLGACPDADPVDFAKTLDAAGKKVGVNFVGGYTALVHKGFSAGDLRLIESIPRALAETDIVCSSVNIGATKAGLNMDAVKLMGEAVKKASELTADRQCIGAAKLVVFCNAPEDNPFMAGAFHGPGEPDCEIHVGVSGPGAVRAALARLPKDAPIDQVADLLDVEYASYELLVVMDARLKPELFHEMLRHYRMMRVDYHPFEACSQLGVRGFYRSQTRGVNRLTLLDQMEAFSAVSSDAAVRAASYDYILPIGRNLRLKRGAIDRLAMELAVHPIHSISFVRTEIGRAHV